MQLIKLHDDFYRIEDAFDKATIKKLRKYFKHRDCWKRLGQGAENRDEGHYAKGLHLPEIESVVSEYFAAQCFANSTQLWYDYEGYINEVHKDLSPNLSANVQIYLCKGELNMGTHCYIDGMWRSVPYIKNGGYLMLNPTQHEHGMRSPVTYRRMSVYQSYRITEEPSPIW